MIVAAGSIQHAVCFPAGAGKEDIQGPIFQIHLPGWSTLHEMQKLSLVMAVMTHGQHVLPACRRAHRHSSQTK